MSGLFVIERKQRNGDLYIKGFVDFHDGSAPVTIKPYRAATNDPALAAQQAKLHEAQIIRDHFGGRNGRPAYTITQGIDYYLNAKQRPQATKTRLARILTLVNSNTVKLDDITQNTINDLKRVMFKNPVTELTVDRELIGPLRAMMRVCAKQKMCERPEFEAVDYVEKTATFFFPNEAEAMITAAADHLKPLLVFLFGTGARLSEALYLDWKDVHLNAKLVIFQPDRTKAKKRRRVLLPPRVLDALMNVPSRTMGGPVFLTHLGKPYCVRRAGKYGQGGGQIQAWKAALRRAGLSGKSLTPHSCRHTYATWHHSVHKDLVKLKVDGGWSSIELVERYAHAIDDGYQDKMLKFLEIDPKAPVGLGFKPTVMLVQEAA